MIEPERGHLSQHFSLVGNRSGQHDIESGQAVRRDDQKMLAQIINVADLAAAVQLDPGRSVCMTVM